VTISPEQMRKKSAAMAESQRQARYSQAEYERSHDAFSSPAQSKAIDASEKRVKAATDKENATIGIPDRSPNNNIRF
jgi:hypothetical protein